jgi:hypothetical protein
VTGRHGDEERIGAELECLRIADLVRQGKEHQIELAGIELFQERRRLLLAQEQPELGESLGQAAHDRRHEIGADGRDDAKPQRAR